MTSTFELDLDSVMVKCVRYLAPKSFISSKLCPDTHTPDPLLYLDYKGG